MSTTKTAVAPALADLERTYDDLLSERDQLPAARTAALRDGDQSAFFEAEKRLALIDEEIADAQASLLAARIEATWTEAERLHQLERPIAEKYDKVHREWKKVRADHRLSLDQVALATANAQAAKLMRELNGLDVELLDAKENTGAAVLHAEELEEQYRALTGRTAPPGTGIRAQPPVLHANTHVRRPNPQMNGWVAGERMKMASPLDGDGSRVLLIAGERPPRWAVLQINNPGLFTPPEPVNSRVRPVDITSVRTINGG